MSCNFIKGKFGKYRRMGKISDEIAHTQVAESGRRFHRNMEVIVAGDTDGDGGENREDSKKEMLSLWLPCHGWTMNLVASGCLC